MFPELSLFLLAEYALAVGFKLWSDIVHFCAQRGIAMLSYSTWSDFPDLSVEVWWVKDHTRQTGPTPLRLPGLRICLSPHHA